MKVKIPNSLFSRAGKSEANINNTLNWILGYISSKNKPNDLFTLLTIETSPSTIVTINEDIIEQIIIKFKPEDYDQTISILLVIAYSLGGMD
jgi:hypothetical protein